MRRWRFGAKFIFVLQICFCHAELEKQMNILTTSLSARSRRRSEAMLSVAQAGGIARGAAALNLLVCQIKSRSEQLMRTVIIPATFSISQLLVNSSSCCL
jgi:hypothetical protein